MSTQLHLANGIVDGRAWTAQDRVALRTLELARQDSRRARRQQRVAARRKHG